MLVYQIKIYNSVPYALWRLVAPIQSLQDYVYVVEQWSICGKNSFDYILSRPGRTIQMEAVRLKHYSQTYQSSDDYRLSPFPNFKGFRTITKIQQKIRNFSVVTDTNFENCFRHWVKQWDHSITSRLYVSRSFPTRRNFRCSMSSGR